MYNDSRDLILKRIRFFFSSKMILQCIAGVEDTFPSKIGKIQTCVKTLKKTRSIIILKIEVIVIVIGTVMFFSVIPKYLDYISIQIKLIFKIY